MEVTNRRKVAASAVLLIASVVLLAGLTFAWFTDSVKSSGNKIAAGTLGISASYQDVDPNGSGYAIEGLNGGAEFGFAADATEIADDGTTAIISEELWEPGKSNAKLVTVTNEGSLAAKVKLQFDVADAGLQDALWFDFVQVEDGAATGQFTKRPMSGLSSLADQVEYSLAAGESAAFVFAYGMDEAAGNEYQGKTFTADISIVATQDTVEVDGFGNTDYDAAAAYPTPVSTADQLADALTAGKTATLTTDIVVEGTLPANAAGNASIDLNGNALTVSNAEVVAAVGDGQSLAVSNGTLNLDAVNDNPTVSAVSVTKGGSVTLDGVTVNAQNTVVFPTGDAASVNIIDSTITAPVYCVGTNAGTASNYNVVINIKNSTLTANDASGDSNAVMINVPGTLTIDGSTITAGRQAVIVRGGTATISNSTITSTGAFSGDDYLSGTWGNGNNLPEAALVLGNRSASYQYAATCTLANVKLVGQNGAPALYMWGNEGDGIGATLTYDSATTFTGSQVYGGGQMTVNGKTQTVQTIS